MRGVTTGPAGKSVSIFDSTVVRVDTDEGTTGYGEVCPLGPAYLPAYASGARAGIAEIAPHLIGEDPRELQKLNRRMDAALKGHPYAKSGIDVACWDIFGQSAGQPVCELLGGRYARDFVLYRAISQESPDAMAAKVAEYRAEGYRRFQLKVGADAETDIERIRAVAAKLESGDRLVADANTGWLMHDAMRVVRAVRDVDVYIEQPCVCRTKSACQSAAIRIIRSFSMKRLTASMRYCEPRLIKRWTWSTSRSVSSEGLRRRGRRGIYVSRSVSR